MIQRFSSLQYRAIWKIQNFNGHTGRKQARWFSLHTCSWFWKVHHLISVLFMESFGRQTRTTHLFEMPPNWHFQQWDSWNDFAGLVFEIRLHLYLFISISITVLSYKCYARSIGSQCSKWIRASFRPATPRKDFSPSITNLCVDGGHDVETSIDPSEHD